MFLLRKLDVTNYRGRKKRLRPFLQKPSRSFPRRCRRREASTPTSTLFPGAGGGRLLQNRSETYRWPAVKGKYENLINGCHFIHAPYAGTTKTLAENFKIFGISTRVPYAGTTCRYDRKSEIISVNICYYWIQHSKIKLHFMQDIA